MPYPGTVEWLIWRAKLKFPHYHVRKDKKALLTCVNIRCDFDHSMRMFSESDYFAASEKPFRFTKGVFVADYPIKKK